MFRGIRRALGAIVVDGLGALGVVVIIVGFVALAYLINMFFIGMLETLHG